MNCTKRSIASLALACVMPVAAAGVETSAGPDQAPPIRSERANELRHQALRQRARGDSAGEIASLRAALVANPGDDGARFALGAALGEAGKTGEAIALIEPLAGRETFRGVALAHLAALERRIGATAREIEHRRTLAGDGRRDLPALESLVAALARAGALGPELDRAADPADPAWDSLRRTLVLDALGRGTDAGSLALETLVLDPIDDRVGRGVRPFAKTADRLSQWEDALRGRLTAGQDGVAGDDEKVPLALAAVLTWRGKRGEALALVESAAARWPGRGPVHYARAALLSATPSRRDEAVASFRRALELDPAMLQAYVALGDLHLLRGADADAEKTALAAIGISPGYAPAYALLGRARLRRGDGAQALTALKSALFLDPSDPSGEARIGLYRTLAGLGRAEEGPAFVSALLPADGSAITLKSRDKKKEVTR